MKKLKFSAKTYPSNSVIHVFHDDEVLGSFHISHDFLKSKNSIKEKIRNVLRSLYPEFRCERESFESVVDKILIQIDK